MPQQANRTARVEARNEAQVIHLSIQDQWRFVNLLLKPPGACACPEAHEAQARLIVSSR
jgi:hypothetical protein